MRSYTCDDLDLLAWLSDALTSEERAAVDLHLSTCAACWRELEQLRQAEELLPLALNPMAPPESLRAKVLAEAYGKRSPVPVVDKAERGSSPSRRQPSWTRKVLPWVLSAALLAVSVGLASQVVRDRQQLSSLQSQVAGAVRTVNLKPAQAVGEASGRAVVIPDGKRVELIVYIANVKPTKGSQVYHVWLWNHGKRSSGGVIQTSSQGVGVLKVSLTGAKAKFDGIGITLEPNAKTTVPTGPKILGASSL